MRVYKLNHNHNYRWCHGSIFINFPNLLHPLQGYRRGAGASQLSLNKREGYTLSSCWFITQKQTLMPVHSTQPKDALTIGDLYHAQV